MRKGILGCLTGLLATAGLAWAQSPVTTPLTGTDGSHPIMTAPTGPGEWAGHDGQGPCGPPGRFWLSGEYLLWWFRNDNVPPLVTTGSPTDAVPGALGQPTTSVLFGGNGINQNPYSGFRIIGGFWLDEDHKLGVEGDYFYLSPNSRRTTFGSDGGPGSPVLTRPFIDALGDQAAGIPAFGNNAEFLAFPGVASGNVTIDHGSRLQGAGLNGLYNICCCCNARFDVLAGFRFLEFRENLGIVENTTILAALPAPFPPAGTRFTVSDQFKTDNYFYGGVLGARAEVWSNMFFARVTGSVALGTTNQQVNINGSTTTVAPDGTIRVDQGGLLALSSNIGNYHRNVFSAVPMVDIKTGVALNDNLRAFVGYTFLYWTNVARPGEQIDQAINTNLVPTSVNFGAPGVPARPTPLLGNSNFWAQGVSFGVELRF